MKTWFLSALTAATLMAAPAFAQGHAQHHPSSSPSTAMDMSNSNMDMSNMTPEQMHEYCKSVMDQQMAGHTPHSHTTDKLGHTPPAAKPLSPAEMQKMHEKCAAIMAQDKDSNAKP